MDDTTNRALHSLDLAPGASLDDVKKSYRELALIWHPDKVPDRVKDRATAKFTEINEAYQWLVRNPKNLRRSSSTGSPYRTTSQRQSPPRYRSSSQSSHTREEYSRSGASRPGASGRTGASRTDDSSGTGAGSSADPAVQRVRQAARGIWTDSRAGLYVYPDIDADRAANFIVALQLNHRFCGAAATVNDLLVFYDIDGSGEEGMAITRSNHLVNNNTGTLYDIGDLVEVRLKEGFFFWSEIVVRRKGNRKFELAGYAENGPGRALVSILGNLIGND
ncbi:MAG: DnaJ domain-containing protein [Gemmatimonadetes bacterium]|nr:DnaJ domain-containing protein [Gemmatimonadota bacterium]MYG83917.1 DnaJ domain-containing protein [Gemmatimonadota bacterium]MYJ89521.1 DnaJ domain-containing protein [Gemmatimonadota bacterium]